MRGVIPRKREICSEKRKREGIEGVRGPFAMVSKREEGCFMPEREEKREKRESLYAHSDQLSSNDFLKMAVF